MARTTESPIRTTARRNARRSRALALTLAAGGALIAAVPASANPALPIPPVVVLSASPNPVVVPTPITLGPALTPVMIGTQVSFSAAGSFDPNGVIIKYEWDVDGEPGFEKTTAAPVTTHRHRDSGTVVVRVRATDNQGLSTTRTTNLIRHRAPIARATSSTQVAVVGDSITFTGGTSSDDGTIVKYEWDLDDNGTFERTGMEAATSFGTIGTKTVRLRVTDNHQVSRTATAKVRIHSAPTASFVTSPGHPVAGVQATLDASTSSDDGSIVKYEWDLNGDGTFETDAGGQATTQTTFASPGTTTVGLRVTDNDGVSHTTQRAVEVVAPGVTPTGPGTGTAPPAQPGTGPGTTPAPDTTAPRMVPLVRNVKMTRTGRVAVRVRCPVGEVRCAARIQLNGTARPLAGRRVGTRSIATAGGRTVVAQVQLTPAARRVVRTRGSLRAQAVIVATDRAGNRATTRTPMTIRR